MAFRDGLQQLGWTDGKNIKIDIRWTNADLEKAKVLARELVASRPDLIFAHTTHSVAALQREVRHERRVREELGGRNRVRLPSVAECQFDPVL